VITLMPGYQLPRRALVCIESVTPSDDIQRCSYTTGRPGCKTTNCRKRLRGNPRLPITGSVLRLPISFISHLEEVMILVCCEQITTTTTWAHFAHVTRFPDHITCRVPSDTTFVCYSYHEYPNDAAEAVGCTNADARARVRGCHCRTRVGVEGS
jgi:hypothetical protein